jgi:hypothetical protein
MKRIGSKWVGGMAAAAILAIVSTAHANLVCPDPHQPAGTVWCDAATPRAFVSETLCVAEPVEGPSSSSIDEEIIGAGVCLNGKFKEAAQLEKSGRLRGFLMTSPPIRCSAPPASSSLNWRLWPAPANS